MSLLTPERVPVKVYRWDDAGAPSLDKTAGCMMAIFEACLVTGYGTKAAAGWSLAFDDAAASVKVLRPEVSPHTDFYMRLSGDTGTDVSAQIYLNMSDANTGDLKLQCSSPFRYAKSGSTGKWLLIATGRSFWFFCEQSYAGPATKRGAFFYAGDLASSNKSGRPVYLQHTGGRNNNAFLASVFGIVNGGVSKSAAEYLTGKILTPGSNTVQSTDINSHVYGYDSVATGGYVASGHVIANSDLWVVPAIYVPFSGAQYNNFAVVDIQLGDKNQQAIVFGTGATSDTNLYIATDEWVY